MGRTIVVFTETEVVVAEVDTGSHRAGVSVPGLGYVRAETQDGQLMYALIDRSQTKVVSDLGVPFRQVAPGTVHIEVVATDDDEPNADFVIISDFERLIVISGTASGAYSTTSSAPGGVPVFVDQNGTLVFGSLRYDAEGDWWTWLDEVHGIWGVPESRSSSALHGTEHRRYRRSVGRGWARVKNGRSVCAPWRRRSGGSAVTDPNRSRSVLGTWRGARFGPRLFTGCRARTSCKLG